MPTYPTRLRWIPVLTLSLIWAAAAHGQEPRALLSGRFSEDQVSSLLLPRSDWRPYPLIDDRPGWQVVPEAIRSAQIRAAEALLGSAWDPLPATVFLEFVRNGNRSNFERLSFGRRDRLATLVLGEVFENRGRFLDDIANGVWAICEESFWGVPAHLNQQRRGFGLPDVAEPTVDLFAAETASLLAWTLYLVGDRLDTVHPLLRERTETEIRRRILDPLLERDDFGWMGFHDRPVNNWNPWINSNWLATALLVEENPNRRAAAVHKILRSLDRFLSWYPADGGCDEGPSYWSRAGASLFDNLELLLSATDGAIDVYGEPLIAEMGRYIVRTYIADRYFINFADASAQISVDAPLVYGYGRRIGDDTMVQFAGFAAEQQGLGSVPPGGSLARRLYALFELESLTGIPAAEPLLRDVWLPETQLFVARSRAGTREGFYVAAKGGHNDESHNHNDVGNFVVYLDGDPVLIDVGAGVYNARTFSRDRYTIWNMQSAFHNLPTVNGVTQKEGRAYQASDVRYTANDRRAELSMDLTAAYPPAASLESLRREIRLDRSKEVVLRDTYRLSSFRQPLVLNLMTPLEPNVLDSGEVGLFAPNADVPTARIAFEADAFDVTFEAIDISSDSRMRSGWGDRLTRLVLTSKSTDRRGSYTVKATR